MMKPGIALIVVALIPILIAFIAAFCGFTAVTDLAYLLAKLSQLLLIPGIVLVVIAARRRSSHATN